MHSIIKGAFDLLKPLLALMLALSLCPGGLPALADASALSRLQPLMDAVTGAALAQDLTQVGSDPLPPFTYRLMLRLARFELTRGKFIPDDAGLYRLSQEELSAWYDRLFTHGSFVMPPTDCCTMITRQCEALAFDVTTAGLSAAGAVPMTAEETQQGLRVVCELYRSDDPDYHPDSGDASQADWFGTGEFLFMADERADYGYTLTSYQVDAQADLTALGDTGRESLLAPLEDEALGFSLMYPALLAPYLQGGNAAHLEAALPDGSLRLTASAASNEDQQTLESLAASLALAHPKAELAVYPEAKYLTLAVTDGSHMTYRVMAVSPSRVYEAALSYALDQKELYALYAEYLENSFAVYEYAVG